MAAANVSGSRIVLHTPFIVHEWTLDTMTADQAEVLSHTMTGVSPSFVTACVTTQATDESLVHIDWTASDTSANTVTVKTRVENGANIAGAVVKVWAIFLSAASGGITAT
jgi:hypothetical protein